MQKRWNGASEQHPFSLFFTFFTKGITFFRKGIVADRRHQVENLTGGGRDWSCDLCIEIPWCRPIDHRRNISSWGKNITSAVYPLYIVFVRHLSIKILTDQTSMTNNYTFSDVMFTKLQRVVLFHYSDLTWVVDFDFMSYSHFVDAKRFHCFMFYARSRKHVPCIDRGGRLTMQATAQIPRSSSTQRRSIFADCEITRW